MKKYLFLGDTHGDLDFANYAGELARRHDAELLQLGDWGYIWPRVPKLDELSDMLVELGVTMRFIDGNHDEHPKLRRLQGSSQSAVTIAPNVIYQPRGSVHKDEDGTRLLFLGGAPSIDRDGRVEGLSWWPEETISDTEFHLAMAAEGPIHVLVTHDAPAFPPDFSPKGSPRYQYDQELSMQRIDALIWHHRPLQHIHGHWHCRYDRVHKSGTLVTGLNCNDINPSYLDAATRLWSRPAQEKRP